MSTISSARFVCLGLAVCLGMIIRKRRKSPEYLGTDLVEWMLIALLVTTFVGAWIPDVTHWLLAGLYELKAIGK